MAQRFSTPVALAALLCLPALALIIPEDALKPADHEVLGAKIAKYVAARTANKDIDKMTADVSAEMAALKKKLKDRDVLSLPVDLGKSLWQSFSYENVKGIKKGKINEITIKAETYGDKATLQFALWCPAKYDPKKAYPLLLCIAEKGVKPAAHLSEKWTTEPVKDGAILACVPMPEDLAQWTEPGSEGAPGGIGNLFMVMRDVTHNYAIDFDRIYLVGRGQEGVNTVAMIGSIFHDRFAGVIGRTGDLSEKGPVYENFRNLPTFFAGAGANATAFADKCDKAGYANCKLSPEAQEADVWTWIQDHPRIANPSEVVLVPGNPFPISSYWLSVPHQDSQAAAMIKGKIDRATNTITLDGEGVSTVTLFFNDQLVDMDKDIKVVCNGAEHLDKVPRNLNSTLSFIYNARSDPGKVYVASKVYDLPAKPKPKDKDKEGKDKKEGGK